jgi:trans-aconitate methyltransferase
MNRERRFVGENSYSKDLRVDLAEFLQDRLAEANSTHLRVTLELPTVRWLDLCCGQGFALRQAAQMFPAQQGQATLEIVGVDLVVDPRNAPQFPHLTFVEAALPRCWPTREFDLITCVHGLHYLGDKFAVIAQAVACLKPDGLFAAHLDPANLRHRYDARFGATVVRWLKRSGFEYHARFRRIICRGPRSLDAPWRFLGADDQAGPNFTGQPAVNSWYADIEPTA